MIIISLFTLYPRFDCNAIFSSINLCRYCFKLHGNLSWFSFVDYTRIKQLTISQQFFIRNQFALCVWELGALIILIKLYIMCIFPIDKMAVIKISNINISIIPEFPCFSCLMAIYPISYNDISIFFSINCFKYTEPVWITVLINLSRV